MMVGSVDKCGDIGVEIDNDDGVEGNGCRMKGCCGNIVATAGNERFVWLRTRFLFSLDCSLYCFTCRCVIEMPPVEV